uniref:Uncharacterized protein n=1 Tax=Candidatus Kentrum sp. DK TaxID=2126562 RepID=A0A450SEG1_9GAMM|nr:MAG: hypothetical protein BECKDK2373C_GA0170839_103115 [Candidatus Kentron sp. DK]
MNRNPDFTALSHDAIDFPATGFDAWKQRVEKATRMTSGPRNTAA